MANNSYILSYKNELYRKIIHILSVIFPITYYFVDTYFYIIILFSTLIILLIDIFRKKIFLISSYFNMCLGSVVRPYEENNLMGASYMMLSFCFITFFFSKSITIPSMIILSLADTFAAIFGLSYGKTNILNNKTLEGSMIFMVTTIIILTSLDISLLSLLIISFIITLTEHVSSAKYDNFTVPIISATALHFLL